MRGGGWEEADTDIEKLIESILLEHRRVLKAQTLKPLSRRGLVDEDGAGGKTHIPPAGCPREKKCQDYAFKRWGGGAHSSFHEFARKDFELFQMWFFGAYVAQADQKIKKKKK